jgi:hypothetical protein
MKAEHAQRMKAATQQILALLTEEQAKRWKEMTGEPLEGLTLGCPPGPPPGPAERFDHPPPPH